jgi:hypothetical protein|tara:strand:- start:1689 stop:1913 length:225 start_codon:yes stop_codon:yes gene_type:complete
MKIFKTSDLALAAYMVTFGMKLLEAKRLSNGRFDFELEDPNDNAQKLSIDFINSDFCRFDNNIKLLKKMLYSGK